MCKNKSHRVAERGAGVRAAVDFAGAAQTWARSPFMRERMVTAVRNAKVPIYFIQAENDQDLSPSRVLAAEMERLGKPHKIKIFPPFGKTAEDGHSFGYFGGEIWGPEVFAFLGETMKRGPANRPSRRRRTQQSLAADGAIAFFSTSLVPSARMLIARRS